MHRREFLAKSGMATVGMASIGLTQRTIAQEQSGLDVTVFNAGITCQAIALGNLLAGKSSASDWNTIANNINAVAGFWKSQNMDQKIRSALVNVRAADLTTANLDIGSFHAQVRAFHPEVRIEDVTRVSHFLNSSSVEMKQRVLESLWQEGFLPTFGRVADDFARLATKIETRQNSGKPHTVQVALHPHLLTVQDCAGINLAITAAGLAFLTIGVMASGGVLLLASWGAIAAWGGGAATLAGVGASIGGC